MFLIFSINQKEKYFLINPQLHPSSIPKVYMKITCLLEEKKIGLWDRTIKPFTKAQISFN